MPRFGGLSRQFLPSQTGSSHLPVAYRSARLSFPLVRRYRTRNGAGKTTALRILTPLSWPDDGRARAKRSRIRASLRRAHLPASRRRLPNLRAAAPALLAGHEPLTALAHWFDRVAGYARIKRGVFAAVEAGVSQAGKSTPHGTSTHFQPGQAGQMGSVRGEGRVTDLMASHLTALTPAAIQRFERDGYVVVRQAFSPADALAMEQRWWRELEGSYGIRRDDRSSWRQIPGDLKAAKRDRVQAKILTGRVRGVLDDLLGQAAWSPPRDWGRPLVT